MRFISGGAPRRSDSGDPPDNGIERAFLSIGRRHRTTSTRPRKSGRESGAPGGRPAVAFGSASERSGFTDEHPQPRRGYHPLASTEHPSGVAETGATEIPRPPETESSAQLDRTEPSDGRPRTIDAPGPWGQRTPGTGTRREAEIRFRARPEQSRGPRGATYRRPTQVVPRVDRHGIVRPGLWWPPGGGWSAVGERAIGVGSSSRQ